MITTIEKLFNIVYGQREYHNKERLDGTEGDNILISSSGEDNGLFGFFDIKSKFKAPFITCPSTGSIGEAFVQNIDCSVDDNCLVLIPKEKISLEELYQISFQIRQDKWRYRYGRQITPAKLNKKKIRIEKFNISYEEYLKKFLPQKNNSLEIKENTKIKLIPLPKLCDFERKSALPQNAMNLDGNIPYVTTSSKANGVSNFVNEESNSKGKCLTVALNGSCGQTFFQIDNFITSGDNAVLKLKGEYNPSLLFYIGFQIYRQRWGFNYYRKLSEKRLRNFMIPMPLKSNGEYDIEYIQKIVQSRYGFNKLQQ